jgi:hypothetical protein
MMDTKTIRITGSSDDLIEIEGDIEEEWGAYGDEQRHIAVSEGTLLSIVYDRDGIWRVNRVVSGTAKYSKIEGSVTEDTFDVVTLEGDIAWVALVNEYAVPPKDGE